MCHVVDRAAKVQARDQDLLQGLMSTLSVSFDSAEVVTSTGKQLCTSALSRIASLSGKGYLKDKDDSQQLVDLVSQYVVLATSQSSRRRLQSVSNPVASAVRERIEYAVCS